MAELLRALTADDNHAKAAEEVADVVIILCRLQSRRGGGARWRSIARSNGISRPTGTATTSVTR
jgi:hypothetical protein